MKLQGTALAAVLVLLLSGSAMAGQPELDNPGLKRLQTFSQNQLKLAAGLDGKSVRRVSGFRWQSKEATPDLAVARFLKSFPELLPVDAAALVSKGVESTRTRSVVIFHQQWKGLPVMNGALRVSVNQANEVTGLTSTLRDTSPLDARELTDIGWDRALEAAWKASHPGSPVLNLDDLKKTAPTARVVYLDGDRITIAYRIIIPTVPMVEKLVCLVDAETGRILKLANEAVQERRPVR